MAFWHPARRKKKPKRKVRRMGNPSNYAELYVFLLLGLVMLVNLVLAIYYSR